MTETSKCPVWIAPINSSREEPMKELIEKQAAIDAVMQYCPDDDGSCSKADRDIRELLDDIENLPSAQPDTRLEKIADLVDGSIDHFDLEDAMDLLYQIKDVLNG